jgi:sialate O-acetylesterase
MSIIISPLISSHMIIQRGVAYPIRGEAPPKTEITVSFLGKTYQTMADSAHQWELFLDSQVPGGPHTMQISAPETDPVIIEDIFIGDVWLCSGQSNMEMPMERLRDTFPEEWKSLSFPPIRQFSVPQEWDFSGPRADISGGHWETAAAETLHTFSGTAWFFAKYIYEQHRIPIGLVATAWGGTPIESWMSREALAEFPKKIALGDKYANAAACSKIIRAAEKKITTWENTLIETDSGLVEKWQNPDTAISDWNTLTLPGNFAIDISDGDRNGDRFSGVIWMCREFDVTADFAAKESQVWLGTITDADTVYINGIEVGSTGYRYPPRKYAIPAGTLHAGTNRIVMKVICWNGEGCMIEDKPLRIFSERGIVELAGSWKYRIGAQSPPRPGEFFFQRQPMGPYNAMIAPVLRYPFKGVIWYQGESNDGNSGEYAALFKSMIQDWRQKSGTESLPFLFVQLPLFGNPAENNESDSWALIRAAQQEALSLPLTGMAVALDLGEWNDLHPLNKKDVGRRLFLAAERVVFGRENTASSPVLLSGEQYGEKLILTFAPCGEGLYSRETPYVSIIASGGIFRCPAEIIGTDTLSIDLASFKKPKKILYAWAQNPRDRQLYNSENLPVNPFIFMVNEQNT